MQPKLQHVESLVHYIASTHVLYKFTFCASTHEWSAYELNSIPDNTVHLNGLKEILESEIVKTDISRLEFGTVLFN